MSQRLKRQEVPMEQTWDLKDLYTNENEWLKDLELAKEKATDFMKHQGHLTDSPQFLLKALNEYQELYTLLIRLGNYSSLKQSEDGTNPENQSRSMTLGSQMSQIHSQLAFIDSELSEMPPSLFESWLNDHPDFKPFENYLKDLFEEKKYKLSPETEKILASFGGLYNSPYRTYSTSKAADMIFEDFLDEDNQTHPNSFVLFENKYEFSPNSTMRRNAYKSFCKTLNQYKNTYAALYATEVEKDVTMSKVRGYESVSHMLLHPHKIDFEMYNKQVQLIYTQLAPHMRKFAKLKKEQLGLDEMLFCDLKAPLDVDFVPPATYDDIQAMIIDSLSILGDDYKKVIEKAFSDRWIDYADNIGKATGAFCASPYGVHPYILISFEENMRLAFTLAHELGHAGHFQLAMQNQNLFNLRPSTYFVEAPSTLNEMLLAEYLMKRESSPRMKRWVILQLLGTYYHNFVTHLLEAEFQRRVYTFAEEGQPLTASLLCQTKLQVIKTFWGDAVVVDEDAGLTWMRQPHYYMGLYPYTYSAGLSASTAIAKQISTEGEPAVERWIKTLKSGGSLSPHELLKNAGIDMSTPKPIEDAVEYVGQLIDELITLF